ncbi:hypothetical protein P7K49_038166, partial [Saguinus oedipus]
QLREPGGSHWAVATCPEAPSPPRPAPTPTQPRAHPSVGPTPRAAGWLQTARESSERGAASGLRAARDRKLCCSPRFSGPAPSPFVNVANPPPLIPLSTRPTDPRSSSPPGVRSGENFKAPDRRLPAYSQPGISGQCPEHLFPREAADGWAGGRASGGLQSAPSPGAPARRLPREAFASRFPLAAL